MANFRQLDDVAKSILEDDSGAPPPYTSDIRRAPAYVWESAPFLWQGPDTEFASPSEGNALHEAIRRHNIERRGISLNPWIEKLGNK